MIPVKIDFSAVTGKIKPMHAINNVPTVPTDAYGLYGTLTRAHVPYGRLHDTGGAFGGSHYVDVENIFPVFSADENDPGSYDFAFTDALLASMVQAGIRPFYRLGCTIENNQSIRPYHILPPADPAKWARICEHIIAHYNEGWARGFRYGIEYWEIWNEPDNEPEIRDNPMWKGTAEQYFELYRIASCHLKACFPRLKIGGYASCGFYALSDMDFSETAHSSSRTGYFIEFFLKFLPYIREHGCPLDFFSWHSYANLAQNVEYAAYARKKLDEYGFSAAEIIFNEWNPGIANRGKARDASDIADMFCAMQHTPTDMAMYYDGSMASSYCGLFDPVSHGIFKAYDAFYDFGQLYALGNEVASGCEDARIQVCAATDGKCKRALVVNTADEAVAVELLPGQTLSVRATDEEHWGESLTLPGGSLSLPAHAVWLLEIE